MVGRTIPLRAHRKKGATIRSSRASGAHGERACPRAFKPPREGAEDAAQSVLRDPICSGGATQLVAWIWVVALVCGGALLLWGVRDVGGTTPRELVKTSTIDTLAPGTTARLYAHVTAAEPLVEPSRGERCIYYRAVVEEETGRDFDGTRHWSHVETHEDFVGFVVEDASGFVAVDGRGADWDAPLLRTEYRGMKERVTIWSIPADALLYLSGEVFEDEAGDGLAMRRAHKPLLISMTPERSFLRSLTWAAFVKLTSGLALVTYGALLA